VYATSAAFNDAIRQSHESVVAASVTVGSGDPISLGIVSGTVDVTSDPGVRRTLTLEVVNTGVEWAALQPTEAIIYIVAGLKLADGSVPHVPLGSFRCDDATLDWTDAQTISITAPDRWAIVQETQFEVTTRSTQSTYVAEIVNLLSVVPQATAARITATGDIAIPHAITYTASREDAVYSLAEAISADVAFAADGVLEIRDLPTAKSDSVWTVGPGDSGLLVTASYDRTRAYTFNVVVVQPTSTDGTAVWAQVTAEDDDPTSPTYVGTFGRVPRFVQSDLVTSAAQAEHVAACQLAQTIGLTSQVTLTAVPQPALDVLDSITVGFPPRPGISALVERHLIDTIEHDLAGAPQQLVTRAIGAAETPTGLGQ
jgi:hypothetical protein